MVENAVTSVKTCEILIFPRITAEKIDGEVKKSGDITSLFAKITHLFVNQPQNFLL